MPHVECATLNGGSRLRPRSQRARQDLLLVLALLFLLLVPFLQHLLNPHRGRQIGRPTRKPRVCATAAVVADAGEGTTPPAQIQDRGRDRTRARHCRCWRGWPRVHESGRVVIVVDSVGVADVVVDVVDVGAANGVVNEQGYAGYVDCAGCCCCYCYSANAGYADCANSRSVNARC